MVKRLGQDNFVEDKNNKIRIKVDTIKCISAAVCLIQAPNTFDLDDEQIAYVKDGNLDELKSILKAAKACPTKAIIIEDQNGNVVWPK